MLAVIIGALLFICFLFSILNQFSFPFFRRAIAQHDRFMLLPKWTFFAPNPGCTDYRLLYRDYDEDEQPSKWEEVMSVRRRSWSDAIWNPDKRSSKGLFDLGQALLIISQEINDPRVLMTTVPYIALAHYIDSLPHQSSVKYRQFVIVQTHGIFTESAPDVLISSGMHRV